MLKALGTLGSDSACDVIWSHILIELPWSFICVPPQCPCMHCLSLSCCLQVQLQREYAGFLWFVPCALLLHSQCKSTQINSHAHTQSAELMLLNEKSHLYFRERGFHNRCLIIEAFRKRVRSQLCYSMRKLCVLRAQGAELLQISVLVLLHPIRWPKTDPFNSSHMFVALYTGHILSSLT